MWVYDETVVVGKPVAVKVAAWVAWSDGAERAV
jgi:hypothetical protein